VRRPIVLALDLRQVPPVRAAGARGAPGDSPSSRGATLSVDMPIARHMRSMKAKDRRPRLTLLMRLCSDSWASPGISSSVATSRL
jgi:hypothetical protein